MSNTLKLIERVRGTTESGTDYAVAKALGMQQSYLIEVKKGRRWPGAKAQLAMATLLQVDLKDIMALVNEDKAKSEAERLHWRSLCSARVREILDSAGPIAASIIAAAALNFFSAVPARAAETVESADLSNLSIMRLLAKLFRRWFRVATRPRSIATTGVIALAAA